MSPLPRSVRFSAFALTLGALLLPVARAATPQTVESTISAVTVYLDRAIVSRTAQVALTAGTQDLLFPNLPATVDPDLLQVSGAGSAEATILDVRAVRGQLEVAANPRIKELQDQVRAAQAELRSLTDRAGVLQQQRDYLEKIKVATTTPPANDGGALPGLDQWERLVSFYAEGHVRLAAQVQEIDRQREDVQTRLNTVQRQLADLQSPGRRAVQNVYVRVDVARPGDMNLKLDYTVAEASWSATYDVRVTSGEKTLSFGYAAMVRQSTGEDWHAVKLTLSTARPAVGGTPPELSPWYVKEAIVLPKDERFSIRGLPNPTVSVLESEAGSAAYDATTETRKMEFFANAAAVETGLTSANFTINHPADIPADNAPHKVAISSHPFEAELTHLAIPKLAELAFLRAAVTNTSEYPLIAGQVNLFLDQTFVARSSIPTVMPAEKFDLDLGVDDGVTVKRKLVNRLKENTGIWTDKHRITYDVVITVQNNRRTASRITVHDQLPVSQHERIVVELAAPPARDVKKENDGTLTWEFELKAGEKRELPLKISVTHPAGMNVDGLE